MISAAISLESDELPSTLGCVNFGARALITGFLDLTGVTLLADDEGVPLADCRRVSGRRLDVEAGAEADDDDDALGVSVSGLARGRSVMPIALAPRGWPDILVIYAAECGRCG